MAVRAPTWLSDALRWRWTPTIALIVGSLLYVLCAMLFVPSDISFSGTAASAEPRSVSASSTLSAAEVEDTAASDEPAATRRQKRQRRRAATADAPPSDAPAEPEPSREDP